MEILTRKLLAVTAFALLILVPVFALSAKTDEPADGQEQLEMTASVGTVQLFHTIRTRAFPTRPLVCNPYSITGMPLLQRQGADGPDGAGSQKGLQLCERDLDPMRSGLARQSEENDPGHLELSTTDPPLSPAPVVILLHILSVIMLYIASIDK